MRKIKQVHSDISIIVSGLVEFVKEYGYPPICEKQQDIQSSEIYKVLLGTKWDYEYPRTELIGKLNPKMLNFVPSLVGRATVNEYLIDPWGNPYNVALDTDNDGRTFIQKVYWNCEITVLINSPFAIWSNGPNGKDELGQNDDICSW